MRHRQKYRLKRRQIGAARGPWRLRTPNHITRQRMTLRAKIFLFLSVIFLALSYTPFGSETLDDIPKPLGVIFFGLFLITWIFPRRLFDQLERDQALRKKLIREQPGARSTTQGPLCPLESAPSPSVT